MKAFCLVVGLVCVNGASIDNLQLDTATDNSVFAVDIGAGNVEAFTWKYDTQTLAGAVAPNSWAGVCGTGTSQSPINIVTADVTTDTTGDIGAVTGNHMDLELDGYLINNGRTLRYSHLGYAKPTITGGALGSKVYAFSHADFHWGSSDSQGTEHTIDGKQYSMEMQMVFYDGTFMSSMDAVASADSDALATVSTFFKLGTSDNANLKPITDEFATIVAAVARKKRSADDEDRDARQALSTDPLYIDESPYESSISYSGQGFDNIVALKLNLSTILEATSIENYYYYDGSMTQPGCLENTKWIINQHMPEISSTQLADFRTLMTSATVGPPSQADSLSDNIRPTQSLGSRTVMQRRAPFTVDETQLKILGGTLAGIPTFYLVQQFLNQPETAKALRENPVAEFITSNLDNLFSGNQEVVEQRSSDEAEFHHHQYQQPVYQPAQYQQYVPQAAPAPQ